MIEERRQYSCLLPIKALFKLRSPPAISERAAAATTTTVDAQRSPSDRRTSPLGRRTLNMHAHTRAPKGGVVAAPPCRTAGLISPSELVGGHSSGHVGRGGLRIRIEQGHERVEDRSRHTLGEDIGDHDRALTWLQTTASRRTMSRRNSAARRMCFVFEKVNSVPTPVLSLC